MLNRMSHDIFLERIIKKEETDGCWEWTGAISSGGYALYSAVYIHRYSYVYYKGKIPLGMVVTHSCFNLRCVNPAHLFFCTKQDSAIRMVRAGRIPGIKDGESSLGFAARKLTSRDVLAIRKRLCNGESRRSIARRYRVAKATIDKIKHSKTYKEIV